MADLEKGFEASPTSVPPPPAYQAGARGSPFNGLYEHFVNDNMRDFSERRAVPVQAFDKFELPDRGRKFPSKKRLAIYVGIGCVFVLGMILVGIFGLNRHSEKDVPKAQAVTSTQTASPTSSSSTPINVSVLVSVSVSTLTSTTTKQKTTTVATTAPTPKSIVDAASSFYAAWSSSVAARIASGQSVQSAALTKYPSVTTLVTTATPPPETVVRTVVESAPTGTKNVLCDEDEWFC